MGNRKSYGQSAELERGEAFFRLINPEEYPRLGINPEDVPIGTFAAEDHPGFLPSRFGGNAYGLGLIEREVLTTEDTDFLESVDFENRQELQKHSQRLNEIYQKLGLLIRFSALGILYYLVPINLVAHSVQEIKNKADEIESLIKRHRNDTGSENLDIGLLTGPRDLIAHELTARFPSLRIHIFDSLDVLSSWRIPLDIIVIPKDPFRYLLEQRIPGDYSKQVRKKDLGSLSSYLAAKLYDLLEEDGRLHIIAHRAVPHRDQVCGVRFKTDEELKSFLLFSHIFKTEGKYRSSLSGSEMDVHLSDLHYYLNRFAFSEPHLKMLLDRRRPEDLNPEAIDRLPYLNISLEPLWRKQLEREWRKTFEPFFDIELLEKKFSKANEEYWRDRIEVDIRMPESLLSMVARRRHPVITLAEVENEIRQSRMQGSPLSLVAEYRKNFGYILDVLKALVRIRDRSIAGISELELNRLANPFRSRSESFRIIVELLEQVPKLEKIRQFLNPNQSEGQDISIVENLEKLSLLGFSPAQLREILLIVAGHTTMGRIVFGKVPARTLQTITDRAREEEQEDVFDLLRVCRLMSMAEIIASMGEDFMGEQTDELFRLYDEAVSVTTDPKMDWESLEDLGISSIGGVQNRAIREMLKFFNLFEFLNTWRDYLDKGPLEKEVICDYDPHRLARMENALQLAGVAEDFRQEFLGDYIFGQAHFFRQFLDSEFHGTGPVFRSVGTRAGFTLLWIAVNASDKNIINFNPILAGTPAGDRPERLNKLRSAILSLPMDHLHPRFFEEMKSNLAVGRPAFVMDSGIRLILNPVSRVLDISFVDIEESIRKIRELLSVFESTRLRNIALKDLRQMERRFSELMSFNNYLDREGCNIQCGLFESPGCIEQKNQEIHGIETRLKSVLQKQIFIPAEIHDAVGVLHEHCPGLLGFIVPELRGMGFLSGISPDPASGTLEDYIMRCLQKYQALVNRDRSAFQDRSILYRLAKQEFGPLAEQDLGASHPQLEALEVCADRVKEKPWLLQALTFSILFQEIGKLEAYRGWDTENYWTHARQGAEILRKLGILKKYGLEGRVEDAAIMLVRYHGIIGHVILGDEPVTALDNITAEKDPHLLDAFLINSVISSAAVNEGTMVSDLLDGFLQYRAVAQDVIKARTTWRAYLRQTLEEKGRAVLDGFLFTPKGGTAIAAGPNACSEIPETGADNESLWQGRQSAAFERLLKMAGSLWVDYEDLQMYLRDIPVQFIYHKKKLKSSGPAAFEKQLMRGVELIDLVSALSPEVRHYLLYCLDHLGGAMRIYDFQKIPDYLGLGNSLKLLIISLQSFHHHFGMAEKGGLISFFDLARGSGARHEVLRATLHDQPFPVKCFEEKKIIFTPDLFGELRFEASRHQRAINVVYRDAVRFDSMITTLSEIWDTEELSGTCRQAIEEVRKKMPLGAEELEQDLLKTFRAQQRRINERVLKEFQEKLAQAESISRFRKVRQEIETLKSRYSFTEEQLFLLEEISEFNRSRVRDGFLDAIYKEVSSLESKESVEAYWNHIKFDLLRYRSFIGKEYEMLLARFIDERLGGLGE